jgi:hypothetical protein
MAEAPKAGGVASNQSPAAGDNERVPFWQRVLDNPFLLLFIGVAVPTILYVIWGIMELVQIPVAKP